MYTGSCLCGEVQFQIEGELGPVDVCYCQQCRKAQGGPLATNAPVSTSAFRITRGAALLTEFESSPGHKRVFCGSCGSPILSRRDSVPDVVRIRVGTVNEPLNVKPAAHFFTASKCNWWDITDDLPRFEEE
jgi:hypothetical protein